jgi:hypothetical protein
MTPLKPRLRSGPFSFDAATCSERLDPVYRAAAMERARELAPVLAELKDAGMSVRQMAAELTARGIPTPTGKRWHAQTVKWSSSQEPITEAWWADVLADPRARVRRQPRPSRTSQQAYYRLADEPRAVIEVACSKCDWKASFSHADLIAVYGAEYPLPDLLDHLAMPGCSRIKSQWDRCSVHYVNPIEGRGQQWSAPLGPDRSIAASTVPGGRMPVSSPD